jgi:hypothetical protein
MSLVARWRPIRFTSGTGFALNPGATHTRSSSARGLRIAVTLSGSADAVSRRFG